MKRKNLILILIILFLFLYLCEEIMIKDKNTILSLLEINSNKEEIIINKLANIKNINANNIFSFLDIKEDLKKTNKEITTINIKETSPLVYIYTTHEKESYDNYNVKQASNYLKEKLEEYEITTISEDKSINEQIYKRNLSYPDTYTISREYLTLAKSNNKSLKYFIDFHRDSAGKSITTKTINNKKYATIMFILSTAHKNYQENEKCIKKIESYIKEDYPDILRNTYIQKKYYYNEDYSKDSYLIEIGGPENTKEEINNTIEVLAKALKKYIKGEKWKKTS